MKRDNRDQFVLEGVIRPSKGGGEVVVFNLDLGFITLSFVVTVPAEGTERGPIYVKYRFNPGLKTRWFDPNFKPDLGRTGSEDP